MIYEKLQNARVLLQNKKIKKSGKNQYYDYFELADFLPAVNEILNELKVHSMFNITREKAILRLVDIEDKTEELFESPFVKAELKGCTAVQALGASITYLKRYLYMNAFEIVEADILDRQTVLPAAKQKAEKPCNEDIVYKTLNNCKTIKSLNIVFNQYKDKIRDLSKFQSAYTECANKLKSEVTNEGTN